MHKETREGAKYIFRSPNYEKAECGDSEDSQCQEGSVHIAKLLQYCGEITAWPDITVENVKRWV